MAIEIGNPKLWSRKQWACKNALAEKKLRIWQRLGDWTADANFPNQIVKTRFLGLTVAPTKKWLDPVKLANFVDASH